MDCSSEFHVGVDVVELVPTPIVEETSSSVQLHTVPTSDHSAHILDLLWKQNQELIKLLGNERSKVSKLKTKIKKWAPYKNADDNAIHILTKYLTGPALEIFKNEVKSYSRKSKKSMRYSEDMKLFCIALKFQSAKAYRFLGKVFNLPSVSTLTRITRGFQVRAGNFKTIIDTLEKKIPEMESIDKLCVLTLDEMAIKEFLSFRRDTDEIEGFVDYGEGRRKAEFANQGLVFMVRGLHSKWKQTLGYTLSNGAAPASEMYEILQCLLRELFRIGLDVKVLVCDQGSNNRSLIRNSLQVTKDNPVFTFEGREVFVMYDAPHLLKSVRNMLQKHDFVRDGSNRISWRHLELFFEEDVEKPSEMRLAPKLTHNHVYTPPLKHMKVKLAAQVFSSTVSAGLQASVGCRNTKVPVEAMSFAQFAKDMDTIYDVFNSSSPLEAKPMKAALSDTCLHWEHLDAARQMFESLQMYDGAKKLPRPPCFDGWLLNIRVMPMIWSMCRNNGMVNLKTRYVQQDCLENLFSIVRQSCGSNTNPTAGQFRIAISHVMLAAVLDLAHPENANCEKDAARHLLAVAGTVQSPSTPDTALPSTSSDSVATIFVPLTDSATTISDTQKCILFYVVGSVLYKYFKHHECIMCKNLLTSDRQECTETHHLYTYLKAYNSNPDRPGDFGSLTVPSEDLFVYFIRINDVIVEKFTDFAHLNHPCKSVIDLIIRNFQFPQCVSQTCHAAFQKWLLETFIRTRLYYVLKTMNGKMSQARKCKENRKLRILQHQ
jgi:hypothetical protein